MRTCLIIEDAPAQRILYDRAMRARSFDCASAPSVAEAGYLLKTREFDVILLDLMVEDGTTLPLVDYLEVMGSRSTIIMVTGTGAFPNGEATVLSPRIDYLLRKPINLSDLGALVDYAMTKREGENP